MEISIEHGGRLHKGGIGTPVAPPKDDALRLAILDGVEAGRPTWPVPTFDGLRVPRLELVPMGRSLIYPYEAGLRQAREVLRPGVLLALETEHHDALVAAIENTRVRDQMRDLAAAALRDVAGCSLDSICDQLGYKEDGDREHSARRTVTRGRSLWAKLAAWPWWPLNPTGGRLPDEWWTLPRVVDTFAAWRNPSQWLDPPVAFA